MEKKEKPITSTATTTAMSVDGVQAIAAIESVVSDAPAVGVRLKTQELSW